MKRGDLSVRMKFADSDVKRIVLGCVSERGGRNYQEDSFGFSSVEKADIEKNGFTAVVADGMGGLSQGAQVSGYVVSAMLEMQRNRNAAVPAHVHLSRSLCAVNDNVVASGLNGGSTAVVIFCTAKGIHWCTAGDSRVYLFRDQALTVLNEDSDYLNRLMEQVISGDMTFDEAGKDAQKDSLAQYIGCRAGIHPEVNAKPLMPQRGDKLLLCTDGVYNALSGQELSEALAGSAGEAAEDLKSRICGKGYPDQDNFTAVVMEFTK